MASLSERTSPAAWLTKSHSEITALAEEDGSIAVVPVGSLEQHGHHLPVATDSLLAEAVAHAGAEQIWESLPVLVTPVVWSGHSPHHLPFGGTLSLETTTLQSLLSEVAETALANEFDAVLFVNGHGGNSSIVASTVSSVGKEQTESEVLGITYFRLADATIEDVRDSDVGGISHGGELETSLMMHLHPALVQEDEIEGTLRDEPYDRGRHDLFDDGVLSIYRTFDEYSQSGAIGAPDRATPEKGEEIFGHLQREMSALLEEIHDQNR